MFKNKINKRDVCFIVCSILIILFSLWKARCGTGGKDEAFYLNTPIRMAHGDILFWDEWNLGTLSSFLLYPLVKIWLAINGSTEGIMVAFREIYIVANVIIGTACYIRLRSFTKYAPFIVSMFMLYAPFNHMHLCYNSMGLMCGFLGVIIMATAKKDIDYFICGLLYAVATLCQPLLAIVFVVAVIFIILKYRQRHLKKLLLFSAACILMAIPILVYFFAHVGIDRLLDCLPSMMKDIQMKHYAGNTIWEMLKFQLWGIIPNVSLNIFGHSVPTAVFSGAVLLVIAIIFLYYVYARLIRKKQCSNKVIVSLCIANVCYSFVCVIASETYSINVILLPWILLGIMLYEHLENQIVKRMYIISLVWSVCHTFSFVTSNCGIRVYAVGLLSATLFSVLIVCEVMLKRDAVVKVITISLALTVLCMVVTRAYIIFVNKPTEYSAKIQSGPLKGVMCSKEEKDVYCGIEKDMSIISEKEKVCILTGYTYTYMMYNKSMAQYTTYYPKIDTQVLEVLNDYYEINSEKKPDYIYVPDYSLTTLDIDEIVKMLNIDCKNVDHLFNGYFVEVE